MTHASEYAFIPPGLVLYMRHSWAQHFNLHAEQRD
jgi:hypothetical protein